MTPYQVPPQGKTGRPPDCTHGGFTLIELMVTLTVGAILLALAAPSFSSLIANQRSKSAASDIYITLAKARSEAIKRNREVTLLPVVAGAWQNGWKILDPTDPTLTTKLDDHGSIANATISGPTSVIYQATGRIKGSTPPAFSITVTGTSNVRCVSADLSGRPYQGNSSC